MEQARHLELLEREGNRAVALGGAAELERCVPSCPDWTVVALLRHVGGVAHVVR
jgi:hypothetical protein